MLRIAVVDDNADICEIVKKEIEYAASISVVVTCYTNPELLKFDIQEQVTHDIYFLDVEMPYINGIELAKYIRENQLNAYIVFLTSHAEFAIHGYDMKI